MAEHPGAFAVQMAATACLYNLTKGDLASNLHPRILERVVELCLLAMEQVNSRMCNISLKQLL